MNDKFDELAKGLAQSVTRRGALRKFGVGLAGMALVAFGLANANQARAGNGQRFHCHCKQFDYGCMRYIDYAACESYCSFHCQH